MKYLNQYKKQKINAEGHNIEWKFTYETWLSWWESTGKLNQRGRGSSKYCMCRIGDTGPYSPDNVYCATNSENIKDAFNNGRCVNTGWTLMSSSKRTEVSRLGGKASAKIMKPKRVESANKRLELIKHIDKTKYGWVSKASQILNVSTSQVKRLIDKYYDGEVYRRK